jgi:hypothetical protein
MVTAVVVAAVVFALFFALFLAWPTIWDKITTVTRSETIDTKSASGDTSRPKTDTEVNVPASGLSPAEIGGIIAGGVVFLIGLIFLIVWLRRRGSGSPETPETPEAKKKRQKEVLGGPARRFRIVTAGVTGKSAAAFLTRQGGRAGRYFLKGTSATLEKQRERIIQLQNDLEKVKDDLQRKEFQDHIDAEFEKYVRNTEKWFARVPEKEWEVPVAFAFTGSSKRDLAAVDAQPAGDPSKG